MNLVKDVLAIVAYVLAIVAYTMIIMHYTMRRRRSKRSDKELE
jgi:heme/copper-type cytochrome/quinol oxidase subunit 2